MRTYSDEVALVATITPLWETAINTYDGPCAAAIHQVLLELFGVVSSPERLALGLGIRYRGEAGLIQTAYAGGAMFISQTAHINGQPQATIISLCKKWQYLYEGVLEGGENASPLSLADPVIRVLVAAYYFADQHRQLLGLGEQPEKPREYYDSIYADRESLFHHSPYALEEKLSKAVAKGNEALALATLHEINAHGEKAVLAKNPLRSVKNSLIGSIAFLARASIQAGVGANDAFALSDALTQRVEEMNERRTVLDFEEHILLQFIGLVHRRLEESYSPPILKVVHYVENHLDAKISLPQAAAYAGVHPVYLSARFKKETGFAFANYVAARKIQESSYFVRHTNYSTSQIASLYGFSSQSYYITTFKKVLGTTPREYRRQLLAE
ncbi:AraC-like DNA-binding protein [Lachnospiraceae bacterium PF1-22]|uniref:helix-turn-helix transcriptional regulator n=1 Tax=Ohessyouella blattaphilus TaxID=2949333 RepID=UPI003E1CC99A